MRPIPAPRIGDSHGLLRAIDQRGRLRTDEFVTEFSLEQLFPPDLENALGRMRHFVSYARSAGLVKEDRGVVELTDIGRRYLRAGDDAAPFDVSAQQAEWLRRQLREKHMTDSIFHGSAIGLSLLASCPPPNHVSTLDFGRSLAYLGRAGWDNENTFQIQGERYLVLLADMELIDADHRLTETGSLVRGELTLPVHMGLLDIAAQLNPGGAEAVRAQAEEEWSRPAAAPAAPAPEPAGGDDYQEVGPGAWSPSAPSASNGEGALPAPAAAETAAPADDTGAAGSVPPDAPAPADQRAAEIGGPAAAAPAPEGEAGVPRHGPAAGPPVPPSDIWEPAGPNEATRAIPAARPPIVPRASEPSTPTPAEPAAPAEMTPDDPLAVGIPTIITPARQPEAPAPVPATPAAADAPGAAIAPGAGAEALAPGGAGAVAPGGAAGAPAPGGAGAVAPPGAAEISVPRDDVGAPAAGAGSPVGVVASGLRGAGGFLDPAAVRDAAEAGGLKLPASVYANVAAALGAGKHVLLTGAPGAGKTALALAIARAAAQAGRAQGATLVTARHRDAAGPELLVDSAKRGRWVIVDELDRARLDRALGPLSTFLSGLPVLLPTGEEAGPGRDWRIVATSGAGVPRSTAALLRRFAVIEVPAPAPDVLEAAIRAAAGGDPVAAAAVLRLLPLAEVASLGAGVFLDAARHAAARRAALPADEATLSREAFAAYVAPLLGDLDELAERRVHDLVGEA